MLDKLDFQKLTTLLNEANNRLALINLKETLVNKVDTQNLIMLHLKTLFLHSRK